MNNILSACLSLLKRKFSAIADERDGSQTDNNSSPRKRLRVQAPVSIHETKQPERAASDEAPEEQEYSPVEESEDGETIEELEAMVKELEEGNERDKKKAEQAAAKLKKMEEVVMECMICRDIIHNPQRLPCGHSGCYGCLRKWWTKRPARDEDEDAEIIDTEAESDTNEEGTVGNDSNATAGNPTDPEPRPRRRHRFFSAVNRKKLCPYCNEKVTCRPVPDFNLRDIVETLCKKLTQPASRIQARSTRRSDLWHGIFHPEPEAQNSTPATDLAHFGPPPPPHPDPILNHFAQAQYRRRVEEMVAQRERVRAQAYEEGRVRGILEIQLRWDRVERARQVALDRALQQRALAPPDPLPVPQAAAPVGEVVNGVENPEDPAPVNDAA